MRIGLISTYPPIECGIATYTENLCIALRKTDNEVFVISQHGASGDQVFPVYNPTDDNIAAKVFNVIAKLTPDVVHIQHEFGLYGDLHGVQIIDMLIRFRITGLPIVTSLHTVKFPFSMHHRTILEAIVQYSSSVIVHEEFQKELLVGQFGRAEKIIVIPHGVRNIEPIPKAKETVGVVGKQVALLCGYFRPTKCFERIVALWPRIAENNRNAILLIAGKERGVEFSQYQKNLFEKIMQSTAKDQIVVLRGQFPQYTFDTIISSADIMLLPYEEGAQSGILSNAAAFRIPVVTSNLLSFMQWNKKSQGGLTAQNDDDYVTHISLLLNDDELRLKYKNAINAYIQPILWCEVVKTHLLAYEKLINGPYTNARYFFIPNQENKS